MKSCSFRVKSFVFLIVNFISSSARSTMTLLMVRSGFPFSLIAFLILLTGARSANYVILSVSKEGLREVRISYRHKLVMEMSLAEVPPANGIAFSRSTDGRSLVETVSRHGLIEDCSIVTSPDDVASFVSEFSRVEPERKLRTEQEIMDIYMGLRNKSNVESRRNHSMVNSKETKRKLTAKLGAVSESLFMNEFGRFIRIKRLAKDCERFYKEAQSRIEALTLLTDKVDELEMEASRLQLNASRELFGERQHRRHRHRHRQHLDSDSISLVGGDGTALPNTSSRSPDVTLKDLLDLESAPVSQRGETYNEISSESLLKEVATLKNETKDVTDADNSLQSSPFPSSLGNTTQLTFGKLLSAADAVDGHESSPPYANVTATNGGNAQTRSGDPASTTPSAPVATAGNDTPDNAISPGEYLAETSPRSRPRRDLLTGWMIFPGTKWCGDGDIAENKRDLGYHVELDKCCRRHDLCPLVIPRLSWKYGMFNYRLHTISHCRCDRKFRKCLKASESPLAHLIGQIFFNVIGPQCFKFKQETTCVQRFWWGGCREWGEKKVAFVKKQRRFK